MGQKVKKSLYAVDIRQIAREFMMMFREEVEDIVINILRRYIGKANQDKILNVKNVAEILDKSEQAVRKRCERNQLPGHKCQTGEYYFSYNELYDFLIASGEDLNVRQVHDEQLGSSS